MSTVGNHYLELVDTVQALSRALRPALAARYESPPQSRGSSDSVSETRGIPNPTLDIVMDPRRLSLSDEIRKTSTAIRQANALLEAHTKDLNSALDRWEGLTPTLPNTD